MSANLLPLEAITQRILLLREQKVLLDADLATLYGVETKALNQAVKRNLERFPEDFMFQLTWEEASNSRSQFVTLKPGANVKYRPYAFTEQGVAMLSSVLKSPQAIAVNVEIMRAFVRLRELIATSKNLAHRLDDLEQRIEQKTETLSRRHDAFALTTRAQLKQVFDVIRELMTPPNPPKRSIGFVTPEEKPRPPKAAKKGSTRRGF